MYMYTSIVICSFIPNLQIMNGIFILHCTNHILRTFTFEMAQPQNFEIKIEQVFISKLNRRKLMDGPEANSQQPASSH